MKRNYLILIIVSIFFISCNKNKNIGGYNVNYNINKKGEYIDVNEKEFYDYQKEFSEESNFKNEKLYNKEIILIIEHENKEHIRVIIEKRSPNEIPNKIIHRISN